MKAARDTRALDLFRAAVVTTGGIALYAGDSAFRLRSLGDLAIEKADDPGRAPMPLSMPYVQANGTPGAYGANTWFSLWTANTAIDLFSAGGNLTPIMPVTPLNDSVVTTRRSCRPWPPTAASTTRPLCCWRPARRPPGPAGGRFDLRRQRAAHAQRRIAGHAGLALPPRLRRHGEERQFQLRHLGPQYAVAGWILRRARAVRLRLAGGGRRRPWAASRFTRWTATWSASAAAAWRASPENLTGRQWHLARARAHAGRTRHRRQRQPLGPLESSPFPFSYSYTNNLFIHDQASDVSLVRAGRDIIAGSFTVAGPGTLEISAGRNIQMLTRPPC